MNIHYTQIMKGPSPSCRQASVIIKELALILIVEAVGYTCL